jgi:hypothetical protein
MNPEELKEDAFDAIYTPVARYGSYLSRGNHDTTRYKVPFEVIEGLVWIGLYVALPILTGVASGVVSTYITTRKRGREKERSHEAAITSIALDLQQQEISRLRDEVSSLMNRFEEWTEVDELKVKMAQEQLMETLIANGVPQEQSASAAEEAISNLITVLQVKG